MVNDASLRIVESILNTSPGTRSNPSSYTFSQNLKYICAYSYKFISESYQTGGTGEPLFLSIDDLPISAWFTGGSYEPICIKKSNDNKTIIYGASYGYSVRLIGFG